MPQKIDVEEDDMLTHKFNPLPNCPKIPQNGGKIPPFGHTENIKKFQNL